MRTRLPQGWGFKLLVLLNASGWIGNRDLFAAWSVAEGGTAEWNYLNTTQPWAGATNYNRVGVKDYPTEEIGLLATAHTIKNGYYPGILADLRTGKFSAAQIVERNSHEFDIWGTGASHILAVLKHG